MDRIGGPLKELLQKLRLDQPMSGWKAVEAWSEVVGPKVARHSRAVSFRDGILIVEVENPAWMTELTYLKRRLVNDLNRRLGSSVITEVKLVPASSPGAKTGIRKEGP